MTTSLLDVLAPGEARGEKKIYGVVIGIVTNNQDPDGMGRVKVRFPWLSDDGESWWARVAAPMAGNGRGAYFLPEVDDEVLVAFELGDIRFPHVLGALWNGQDKPPVTNQDGKNNIRIVRSRSGHVIRLDDTEGAEKIEIIDKSEKNSVVIDTAANSIAIKADGDITVESSQGRFVLKAQTIGIQATGQDVKIEATNIELKASAQLTLKGSVVNIN